MPIGWEYRGFHFYALGFFFFVSIFPFQLLKHLTGVSTHRIVYRLDLCFVFSPFFAGRGRVAFRVLARFSSSYSSCRCTAFAYVDYRQVENIYFCFLFSRATFLFLYPHLLNICTRTAAELHISCLYRLPHVHMTGYAFTVNTVFVRFRAYIGCTFRLLLRRCFNENPKVRIIP